MYIYIHAIVMYYTPDWELVLNMEQNTDSTDVPHASTYGTHDRSTTKSSTTSVTIVPDAPPSGRRWKIAVAAAAAAACVYAALKD